ncbi:hypothetical protein ACI2VD_03505 [Ralstonia nicotianae]
MDYRTKAVLPGVAGEADVRRRGRARTLWKALSRLGFWSYNRRLSHRLVGLFFFPAAGLEIASRFIAGVPRIACEGCLRRLQT